MRKDLSPITKLIASLEILVDKMHMAGHTDKWCKETCDSRKFPDLNNVNIFHGNIYMILLGSHALIQ